MPSQLTSEKLHNTFLYCPQHNPHGKCADISGLWVSVIFHGDQYDALNVAPRLTSAAVRASGRAVWAPPACGASEHLCASRPRAGGASCAPQRPSLPHFALQSWKHPEGPQWKSRRSLRGGMKHTVTQGEHACRGSVDTQAMMTHLPEQHWASSECLPAPSPPLTVWPPK